MSVNVNFNGSTYPVPVKDDKDWAVNLTQFLQALAQYSLTQTPSLSAELDLGSTYGVRSKYLRSKTTNPAAGGVVRLARTDGVRWRNITNDGDYELGVDSSGNLEWSGTDVILAGTAQTLVSKTLTASPSVAPPVVTMGFVSSGNDTTIRYSCPGGPAAAAGTTELQFAVPYAGVLRNLYVKSASAPTGTCTFTVRKNGVDGALTCTVTSGNTTGNDTTHSITVAAGDLISIKHVMTSGNAPGATTVSFQITQA